MDNSFLDKVVDQIVSETKMGHDKSVIDPPFYTSFPSHLLHISNNPLFPYPSTFSTHCREVYGLNEDEIEYVWNEYKKIIKDKIKNNGL
jgi:hypothetical protein